MAFEAILLGLPRSGSDELKQQPGLEEIIGGAQDTSEQLLDGIERYFDPGPGQSYSADQVPDYNRAPKEFLDWLAGWVALVLRDDWSDDHKRRFIAEAVSLYRLRGTQAGVIRFVQTYIGTENVWVYVSDEKLPAFQINVHSTVGVDTYIDGGPPFCFRVRLISLDLDKREKLQKQTEIIKALIELQKPAHTSFTLEIWPPVIPDRGERASQ
jgi:phage tail-like protein